VYFKAKFITPYFQTERRLLCQKLLKNLYYVRAAVLIPIVLAILADLGIFNVINVRILSAAGNLFLDSQNELKNTQQCLALNATVE
jgi:hypothetical protein